MIRNLRWVCPSLKPSAFFSLEWGRRVWWVDWVGRTRLCGVSSVCVNLAFALVRLCVGVDDVGDGVSAVFQWPSVKVNLFIGRQHMLVPELRIDRENLVGNTMLTVATHHARLELCSFSMAADTTVRREIILRWNVENALTTSFQNGQDWVSHAWPYPPTHTPSPPLPPTSNPSQCLGRSVLLRRWHSIFETISLYVSTSTPPHSKVWKITSHQGNTSYAPNPFDQFVSLFLPPRYSHTHISFETTRTTLTRKMRGIWTACPPLTGLCCSSWAPRSRGWWYRGSTSEWLSGTVINKSVNSIADLRKSTTCIILILWILNSI